MSAARKNMSPDFLNILLLLKENRKFWPNPNIIQKVLNERKIVGLNDDETYDKSENEIDGDSEEEF